MEFDEKVKEQLIIRGFTKEQLLNNRVLIGATINETVVMLVKKSPIHDVIECKICNDTGFKKIRETGNKITIKRCDCSK